MGFGCRQLKELIFDPFAFTVRWSTFFSSFSSFFYFLLFSFLSIYASQIFHHKILRFPTRRFFTLFTISITSDYVSLISFYRSIVVKKEVWSVDKLRATYSERRQHLTKIDLPGCCWIFLFPIAFFFPSLPSPHSHTQRATESHGNQWEKSSFCCCRFRFFPQIEASLSRHSQKNSLHFRWLRFLHDLIFFSQGRCESWAVIIITLGKFSTSAIWHWNC